VPKPKEFLELVLSVGVSLASYPMKIALLLLASKGKERGESEFGEVVSVLLKACYSASEPSEP